VNRDERFTLRFTLCDEQPDETTDIQASGNHSNKQR